MMAMFVAATFAFRNEFSTDGAEENKKKRFKRVVLWWMVAGLIGGISVFFRPDSGLFVAAVGLTLVIGNLWRAVSGRLRPDEDPKRHRFPLSAYSKNMVAQTLLCGAIFSVSFALLLVPWTIRNWRIFHLFQPLAPAHAEMPGEFVP